MELHKSLNSQRNFEGKKNKAGSIRVLDFKLYYKAIVIKSVQYWHTQTHRQTEQNQEPSNIKYTVNKGEENIRRGKNSLFCKQWWINRIFTCNK